MDDLPFIASSLVDIGSELLSRGNEDSALGLFDAAHRMIDSPSPSSIMMAVKEIPTGTDKIVNDTEASAENDDANIDAVNTTPDLYHKHESDAGPRVLPTPIRLDQSTLSDYNVELIHAVVLYNKALAYQLMCRVLEAKQLYKSLVQEIHHLAVNTTTNTQCVRTLLEMKMRVYNNLGVTAHAEKDDDSAMYCFGRAGIFSRQLIDDCGTTNELEHATILSNRCRLLWMRGDMNDSLCDGLHEILRIRSSLLPWDHPDVAAAHFNLGVAEYNRNETAEALVHLKKYLHVAVYRRDTMQQNNLDPISAMIYLLLIQNEDKDDGKSQELIREIRLLRDRVHGREAYDRAKVALSLNAIGSLLFSRGDLDDALVFFLGELRLEEQLLVGKEDLSVSVTCNNVGRIFQELEMFDKAIHYFERALEPVYGNVITPNSAAASLRHECDPVVSSLLSAVWYNLGLLHDKRGSCSEAISAFKMSLELKKSLVGSHHPDVACLYFNIGVLQMEEDKLDEALFYLKEALRARPHDHNSKQLNHKRVAKTLAKLAALQRNKGKIQSAVDALIEVLRILKVSTEFDTNSRLSDVSVVLRSISELYHAMGDLPSALLAVQESVRQLDQIAAVFMNDILINPVTKIALAEQIMSSLLLICSLHHEMCEPRKADTCARQAARIFQNTLESNHDLSLSSSLVALHDVACLLVNAQCAPMA